MMFGTQTHDISNHTLPPKKLELRQNKARSAGFAETTQG